VTQSEDFKAILIQIERELKINTIYKQANINIEKLALKINQSAKLTSYVITNCFEMNFNRIKNSHRIEEAIQKLKDKNLKEYTIEALWSEIGFSNRTNFYKKFKETTKMTPFEYAKLNQSYSNLDLVSQKYRIFH
jgi:AraC-like DNA-binding protein